jgi:hypothetical protein
MKIHEIVDRYNNEVKETATAGGTSAGGIAGGSGFALGIGSTERAKDPTKKKTKSKLIKR